MYGTRPVARSRYLVVLHVLHALTTSTVNISSKEVTAMSVLACLGCCVAFLVGVVIF